MKWINPEGFKLVKDEQKSTWWKAIYHFTLDKDNPLALDDENGNIYQPHYDYLTDMNSVPRFPPLLQFFMPKDRFLACYIHDPGYEFGGLFVNGIFKPMSREEIDQLYYGGMLCDPIKPWRITAWLVWKHVRLWGSSCYNQRTDFPKESKFKYLIELK